MHSVHSDLSLSSILSLLGSLPILFFGHIFVISTLWPLIFQTSNLNSSFIQATLGFFISSLNIQCPHRTWYFSVIILITVILFIPWFPQGHKPSLFTYCILNTMAETFCMLISFHFEYSLVCNQNR